MTDRDESTESWEIDQDDFGDPLVRHRHPTTTIAAHVTKSADGIRHARCPDCGERFDIPSQRSE